MEIQTSILSNHRRLSGVTALFACLAVLVSSGIFVIGLGVDKASASTGIVPGVSAGSNHTGGKTLSYHY